MEKEIKTEEKPEEIKKVSTKKQDFGIELKDMVDAGVYYGHRTSRIHPKMKPYISGTKSTTHIIDLEKTIIYFNEALKYIKDIISEDKVLLFIGTKVHVKKIVEEIAKECGLPYINERWLGGTFTNFETIKKRIDYFKDLEKKKETGELQKYTKKERLDIDKELVKLEIKFGGIKKLEKLPDAIFVIDMRKDNLAIKEARKKGIKVVSIADTNVDPTLADYPIPANDDAISSVTYILNKVKEAILENKSKVSK
ncbi:MAG: 30S ribosomal protein S2 [Candidatus Nealsonbacteria bacterium]